jgi:catechol 2,3-dioxygenase-like lactoylglutathione lyase family enzyme
MPKDAQPERGGDVNIEFLSTVAVIAPDPPQSRKLYVDALGLPLDGDAGDYQHTEQIDGCKSFGIWPLSQAAEGASARQSGRRGGPCRR